MGNLINYAGKGNAVEHLVFITDDIEKFIAIDHEIWTLKLAQYEGFISKDIFINETNPNEIQTILYWETLEQWKSIPHDELKHYEELFQKKMDGVFYNMKAALHTQYQLFRVQTYTKAIN